MSGCWLHQSDNNFLPQLNAQTAKVIITSDLKHLNTTVWIHYATLFITLIFGKIITPLSSRCSKQIQRSKLLSSTAGVWQRICMEFFRWWVLGWYLIGENTSISCHKFACQNMTTLFLDLQWCCYECNVKSIKILPQGDCLWHMCFSRLLFHMRVVQQWLARC